MSVPDLATVAIADLKAPEVAGLFASRQVGTPAATEAARVEFPGQNRGKVEAAHERPEARTDGQNVTGRRPVLDAIRLLYPNDVRFLSPS